MTLFRSLPGGQQQIVKEVVNSGELVLDTPDPSAPAHQGKVVEAIVAVVAKDLATDTILRMTALHKEACACALKTSKSIFAIVERFVDCAQVYLKLENAYCEYADYQTVLMLLLSNDRVPPPVLASIINNLVQFSKAKSPV